MLQTYKDALDYRGAEVSVKDQVKSNRFVNVNKSNSISKAVLCVIDRTSTTAISCMCAQHSVVQVSYVCTITQ